MKKINEMMISAYLKGMSKLNAFKDNESGEVNMVARTGYLMQMNISQKMTDAGFNDSDRENFDMTKMYTMVQIHSEADVDSVFMGMFEKKTVNGEESYSLNFDGNGSSTDRLVYNGFIGY